ncbi:hypothetical protein DFH09DRAFT_1286517, partial [Mycena vulgaris]
MLLHAPICVACEARVFDNGLRLTEQARAIPSRQYSHTSPTPPAAVRAGLRADKEHKPEYGVLRALAARIALEPRLSHLILRSQRYGLHKAAARADGAGDRTASTVDPPPCSAPVAAACGESENPPPNAARAETPANPRAPVHVRLAVDRIEASEREGEWSWDTQDAMVLLKYAGAVPSLLFITSPTSRCICSQISSHRTEKRMGGLQPSSQKVQDGMKNLVADVNE